MRTREHLKRINALARMGSNTWMLIDAWTRNTAAPGMLRLQKRSSVRPPTPALAELGPRQLDSGGRGGVAIYSPMVFFMGFHGKLRYSEKRASL